MHSSSRRAGVLICLPKGFGNFAFGLGFWGAPFLSVFGTLFGRKKGAHVNPLEQRENYQKDWQKKKSQFDQWWPSGRAFCCSGVTRGISQWMHRKWLCTERSADFSGIVARSETKV